MAQMTEKREFQIKYFLAKGRVARAIRNIRNVSVDFLDELSTTKTFAVNELDRLMVKLEKQYAMECNRRFGK